MSTDQAPAASAPAYLPGTHRVVTPEETLARARPWLPAMGITRIAELTGLDRVGIPTVAVCRPNSRSIAVAQGKGLDLAAAKASGVMEAVETYHAESITLPVRYARCADLAGEHRLASVDAMPLRLEAVPEDRPLLWIEGRDAADSGPRWLPLEAVSTDYTLPEPPGSGVFQATSNGLASGNTLDEACLHALCELVERDATTLWELGGAAARRRTRLDLATVDDGDALGLIGRFARAGVALAAWEVTSDVGLASFVVLAAGSAEGTDPELGAGCHPARNVALCRALTEAAQARVGFISGARDDLLPGLYLPQTRQRRTERARAWLAEPETPRRFADAPDHRAGTPAAMLAHATARLRAVGLGEMVVVDLTKPAIGIPVVRVVVPGLEGPRGEAPACRPGRRGQAVLSAGT